MAETTKISHLEGLRGIAAIIVILSHFVVGFYPALYNGHTSETHTTIQAETYIYDTPLNIFYAGNFAVCIFFVISGFVLSHKFFKEKIKRSNDQTITEMAITRYFRLLPLILFSIVTAYIILKSSLFFNQDAGTITKSTWWLSARYNFSANFTEMLRQAFFDVFFLNKTSYNGLLWTITYEFYGSFTIFGILYLLGNNKIRYFIYGILIIFLADSYYGAFIYGLLLSDIYNNHFYIIDKLKTTALIIFTIGLIIGAYPPIKPSITSIYNYLEVTDLNSMVFYHNLGALLITISIFSSTRLQAFFSKKPFTYLGKISFATYVIHLIIICSLSSYIFLQLNKILNYHVTFLITFSTSIIAIITSAHFMQKYIDQPGVKMSKSAYSKLEHLLSKT